MDLSNAVAAGVLTALAVFCLLAAYYLKSDYLRDNFLKIKEKEITWEDTKKQSKKEKKMNAILKEVGSKKTYGDLQKQGLIIVIFGVAIIFIAQLPIFLAVLPLIIYVKYPDVVVMRMKKKRMEQVQEQLSTAIDRIQQVLNVGGQMSQGFEEVANECKDPIASEFRKICLDLSTGARMKEALENFYQRCPLADVKMLCVGCIISDTVSKEVAVQTLKMTEKIIHQRGKQTNEIKSLVHSGEILVKVLAVAPAVGLVGLYLFMPGAVTNFFTSIYGMIGGTVAVILNIAGYFLGKRVTDPDRIINY